MKIISWNLLHRAGATLEDIERVIGNERPDLLLMQETTREIDALPGLVGGHYARDPLPGRRHGLAAWSPTPFLETPAPLTLQPGLFVRRVCQIIRVRGSHLAADFVLANVHLSHGQVLNRRQLRRVFDVLPARAAVLGDCNMLGPIRISGFRDVGSRLPTHMAGKLLPLRLDRCFIRDLRCLRARVLPKGNSDHHPIEVVLSDMESERRDF